MLTAVVRRSLCPFLILLALPLWAAESKPAQPAPAEFAAKATATAKSAPAAKVAAPAARKKAPAPLPLDWKAGVATAKITPNTLMWMAGYAARKKPAEGILRDLFAKALEDEGGRRVVIVTMDLIGVLATIRENVEKEVEEKYKLPPAALLLNASHTHSGPEYRERTGREEEARNYHAFLQS